MTWGNTAPEECAGSAAYARSFIPAFALTASDGQQIHTFQRQIQNLRRTRDLLLPRLMSGQVELKAN